MLGCQLPHPIRTKKKAAREEGTARGEDDPVEPGQHDGRDRDHHHAREEAALARRAVQREPVELHHREQGQERREGRAEDDVEVPLNRGDDLKGSPDHFTHARVDVLEHAEGRVVGDAGGRAVAPQPEHQPDHREEGEAHRH